MLSVLVINRDRRELLERCLASIDAALATVDEDAEVIVIDNGSTDGSSDMVRARHPGVRLIVHQMNTGFAPAVVEGCSLLSGEWLAIVNNDAWIEATALQRMLTLARSMPGVGAVSAQVRFAQTPEVINSAGLEIDSLGIAYDRHAGWPAAAESTEPEEVFGASGCVVLYRMSMLTQIGGFDASFFAFAEDADVAWRSRMAGWRAMYEPRAVAFHAGSATAGERSAFKYELVGRNRVRLIAKNATTRQLLIWGPAMLLYDTAYVLFVALGDRTLAPVRGRVGGLREWPRYRRAGASYRRPTQLSGASGWKRALQMRLAYDSGASR